MSTHQTAAEELLLPRITPLGDAALLVSFEGFRNDGRQAAAGLVEACRNQPLEGVLDIVQAFDRVGVYFDPNAPAFATVSPSARVAEWMRACWLGVSGAPAPTPRVHTIAVCYDREFSLDLPGLAAYAGLSEDEVIRRHSAAEYTVGAVGFAPGFAYLEGLPAELHTPRRDRPRTRVEAGAVAIGGPYTAIYPNASPGGWNLIGRCPRQLFDSQQDPPAVFQAGDRVRFEQIDRDRFAELKQNTAGQACRDERGLTVLRIVSPGVQASLQDLGRGGARRWGVSAGGAMDTRALKIANALVGNPENAPVIEATLVGPVVECLSDCVIGVAGGVPERIGGARRLSVSCGERIDLRELTSGRIYLAVQGGFVATDVLGGRGTDLQAGFGGYAGRPLRAGDTLCRNGPPSEQGNREAGDWFVGRTSLRNHSDVSLRVLPGPDRSAVDAEVWRTFLAAGYEVSSESNRMGIRLRGPCVPVEAGAVAASFPVGPGAIQIPPGGGPIVLSADSQTLGGYPVVACVVAADLPKLGQLRPAAIVRFAEVTMEQAECYRRAAERDLSITLAGIALANRGP